jgi:hypothetical protein
MGVALVWVLLMVAVSLGIMAAIHAGPSAQTSGIGCCGGGLMACIFGGLAIAALG